MKNFAIIFTVLMISLVPSSSGAMIIYEQYGGPVSGNNIFCYNSVFVAQDFTVAAPSILSSFTFNAMTVDGQTVPLSEIHLGIYTNNSGAVGELLHELDVAGYYQGNITSTWDNGTIVYTFRDYTVELPNYEVAAGNYYLALTVGPPQWDMHWAIPTWDTIGDGSYMLDDGVNWRTYLYEGIFRIEGNGIPTSIDILPGDPTNTINLKRTKSISVAILSTANFYAPDSVVKESLTFGRTGDEGSYVGTARKQKDVNGDGIVDLTVQFSTKLTGLQCGDTEVFLMGEDITGRAFVLSGPVLISPCR